MKYIEVELEDGSTVTNILKETESNVSFETEYGDEIVLSLDDVMPVRIFKSVSADSFLTLLNLFKNKRVYWIDCEEKHSTFQAFPDSNFKEAMADDLPLDQVAAFDSQVFGLLERNGDRPMSVRDIMKIVKSNQDSDIDDCYG